MVALAFSNLNAAYARYQRRTKKAPKKIQYSRYFGEILVQESQWSFDIALLHLLISSPLPELTTYYFLHQNTTAFRRATNTFPCLLQFIYPAFKPCLPTRLSSRRQASSRYTEATTRLHTPLTSARPHYLVPLPRQRLKDISAH